MELKRAKLVGRVDEIAALERLLGTVRDDGATVVLVTGEAGMGKSRLVGELRQRAEAAGALVATGRTPSEGASLPYGTIVGLVRDLARKPAPSQAAQLLEPVQQLLLGSPPDDPNHGRLARIQLFDAMLRAVEGLAEERPVVLILEDLHWADTGSVELLDYLARNIDATGVLIAATYRSDEIERRPSVRRVLTELRMHEAVRTFDLTGLSRDETATLLADVTGETPSWAVVDAVHARSEGNPLFAEELVRVHETDGLPPALRDLLAVRIAQLPPNARVVVGAAAVLGVSADYRLIERVTPLEANTFDAAFADAVRHGTLIADPGTGGVRFRHALLREAAYAALLPAERVRMHHRAADMLADDPTLVIAGPGHAAAQIAEHRFEAGDWAAACSASLEAMQASTRLYSIHAANTHLKRAVECHTLAAGTCTHPAIDDSELYRMAAESAYLVGELDEAFAFAGLALDALDPSLPAHRAVACLLQIARCAWNVGRADAAFAALAEAETRLGDVSTGADVAEVMTMRARLLMAAGHAAESITYCEAALPLARAENLRVTEAHILASLGPNLAGIGETGRALEIMHDAVVIAEEVRDPDVIIRVYNNLTDVQYTAGQLQETAAIALDAMHESEPLAVFRLGGAGLNAVEALLMLGRWDEAERLNVVLTDKASAGCTSDLVIAALTALRRGNLDEAQAALDLREPISPQSIAQHWLVRAEIELERGQPDEAVAAIDRTLGAIAGADFLIEFLTAHALGLRALADQAAQPTRGRRGVSDPTKLTRLAASMLDEVDRRIAELDASGESGSPWIDALGAQCRAEEARVRAPDAAAWVVAASAWEELGAPFHVASCRLREAEALLAERADRRRATEALLEAWRAARRLGAAALEARCVRLAQRARVDLEDPHDDDSTPRQRAAADLGLTAREVEVLDLLVDGRTDAQIADELYISKKTASVHVSNILRKLDASNRWDAADIGRAAGLGVTD